MKITDRQISSMIETAHNEYRRALVDPMSVKPWHALPTDERIAFTKAVIGVWNIAMHDANVAFIDLTNDADLQLEISKSLAALQVLDV